jgi:hypothetical protein
MVIVPQGVFESLRTHWREYLTNPTGHLFSRKYDAAGFFGHVADVAGDDTVAKRLIPAFVAGGFGHNDTAYHTLVSGFEDKVLDTWAPSYFRAHELQFLWTVKGPSPGNFPSEKVTPEALTVGPDETVQLTAARPWELSLVSLDSSADVVWIVSGQGHVAIIDRTEQVNKTLTPMQPIALCVRGDCKCPPDQEGDVPPTIPALAKIDIGLTGGDNGAFGWAKGQTLADFCDPKKRPSGPMGKLPNGITGGSIENGQPERGSLTSDPHIVTLDGNSANDPVVATTSMRLADSPSYDDLYTTFANSWRIASSDSLFDYGTNESTETFTDRAFPDRDAVAANEAAIAAAQGTCKTGGITDTNLLRNCAFDIAATGNVRYVRAYQPQQARADLATMLSGLRGGGVVTTTTASSKTKSVVLDGRVTDASADAFASFEGFKNDTIYLDPAACQKPRFMQLLGPDNKSIGGASADCGLRLMLPADGTYRFALNPFHDFTGPYKFSIAVVRPDRVTTLAPGDVMSGTLAARAEHDVFLVTMKSPGAITIGGDGCDASFDVNVYYGDDELVTAGPACRLGKITLPKAGTYRIVLNPFNNTTGAYKIPTS